MKQKINNNRGVALIATMFFAVILYSISAIFLLRTINEQKMTRIERDLTGNFYAAQGGAEAGIEQLDILINTYLRNTISSASPSGVANYTQSRVASGKGVEWLVYAVRDNNTPVLTENGDQAEFTGTGVMGSSSYTYKITITEKIDPYSVGNDAWEFPFMYSIESIAQNNDLQSRVVISGDFTVQIQKDNFAKFALFTNRQKTPGGTKVWFTNNTNFLGPLHTNDRFNFALNPSGTFDGVVAQKQDTARFYNNGWPVLIDADQNGDVDVPTFNAGFNRGVDEITVSSSTLESDMVDQVSGGQTIGSNGIYVPNDSGSLTGGIYVKGDCSISMNVDGNNNAVYSISQGGVIKNITVDAVNNQTTVETIGVGTETYAGIPDGVDDAGSIIYADGNITSLGGTIQEATELTIASSDDIVISDDVMYSDYAPGSGNPGEEGYVPPSVQADPLETKNLLGLVSWDGDVRIGSAAPDDINVHATIFAENGIFTVDNYNSGSPRGTATLLGGVITDDYGAFGTFNPYSGQTTGYGRNFVYDSRMMAGKAPPYFPTLNTFIAFTNDITDKLVWQEGE